MQDTSKVVLLKLEGTVTGPWVEELQKAWLTATSLADHVPVTVNLAAVSFVDTAGRDLLLRMRKQGVVLNGASSFLRHMLGEGSEAPRDLKLTDRGKTRSSK